ncbi:helix-turn-helix transcriptional regulator [Desulfogranum marinum]|uniref:helix-turn-helix transcriptional regulator n=1 Tax=Desulfogranum marinum TaxID=453220 RepID=UPI001965F983|nr:helix-turn-helix domain-containing protein [Desulfogranum marinum]MBM9515037.1 helix-turn-helix domain-containing protein [Desulfogranum marinum]
MEPDNRGSLRPFIVGLFFCFFFGETQMLPLTNGPKEKMEITQTVDSQPSFSDYPLPIETSKSWLELLELSMKSEMVVLNRDDLLDVITQAVNEAQQHNQSTNTYEGLIDEKKAAQFLGVKTQTMSAWRHRATGPEYIRAGSRIGYLMDDLRAYLEANRVKR